MDLDGLKATWQQQPGDDRPMEVIMSEVKQHADAFERAVVSRDARETIAGMLVAAGFAISAGAYILEQRTRGNARCCRADAGSETVTAAGHHLHRRYRRNAVARVDEARVNVVTRTAIGADGTRVYQQRYPAAGTPNALVELYVMRPDGSGRVKVDLGSDTDIYLARVNWAADGRTLLVQRESRDQKRLDMLSVDPATGRSPDSYAISAFTHPYHGGYGGPEIDQHKSAVKAVSLADDGLSAVLSLDKLDPGFVYEFDLARLRSRDQDELLHRHAYYTVNEIPAR